MVAQSNHGDLSALTPSSHGKEQRSLSVFPSPEVASAHGIPDGTVPCSWWLVILSDSCGMVLVHVLCGVTPYVVCDLPDVALMSGCREFCMSSVIHVYHMAERPLSRRAGLV